MNLWTRFARSNDVGKSDCVELETPLDSPNGGDPDIPRQTAHAVVKLFARADVVDVVILDAGGEQLRNIFGQGQCAGSYRPGGFGDSESVPATVLIKLVVDRSPPLKGMAREGCFSAG